MSELDEIEVISDGELEQSNVHEAALPQTNPLRKSGIWGHFDNEKDKTKAKCHHCPKSISRGGIGKAPTNTNMINHLKRKHKEKYAVFLTNQSTRPGLVQPKIIGAMSRRTQWDISDPKAVTLHYKIAEMIALDNEPLRLTERVGFQRLLSHVVPQYKVPGRTFFTTSIIPDIYQKCKFKLQTQLSQAKHVSFTTDIWTANNNDPFISLTAHWITENFEFQHFVLHSSTLPGSHTGEAFGTKLEELFKKWGLDHTRRHLVMRDNAPNMIKGLTEFGIENESCLLHTLQLSIADSIKCQRSVTDMIAASRHIVTHFSHSALACSRLKEIQNQLKLKPQKLIQDVPTRWNSTFYMLENLLAQSDCITLFADDGAITNLSENQWYLFKATISLLQPFEEITKLVSESKCHISEAIPTVATLLLYLTKHSDIHFGVGTMKETLKARVEFRLNYIFNNHFYTKACFLDPRFKMAFFKEDSRDYVKNSVIEELCAAAADPTPLHETASCFSNSTPLVDETYRQDVHSAFMDCFTEMTGATQNSSTREFSTAQNVLIITSEVSLYLSLPLISRKEDPLQWWKQNFVHYPNLSRLAKKYLSAPASTVYSERLFSTEGNIYDNHRNRLLPINGESLTFLNRNLPLLNHKY